MSLGLSALMNAITSHAAASGQFDRVAGSEPKNAPGKGISAAVWVDRVEPIARVSGLASSGALVVLNVRVYTSMLQDPPDMIDPNLVAAVDALITAYSGDFQLGGSVRNVDLLGAHSSGLGATAGYLEQDGKLFRVMTITLPLVVTDAWEQVP